MVSESKTVPLRHAGAKGERKYSSYSFFTSALDWVGGKRHPRPSFTPGKGSPVPIGQDAGWGPEPVWTQRTEEKIHCLYRTAVVQSVVRHCTV
jgi:hypothetical protein